MTDGLIFLLRRETPAELKTIFKTTERAVFLADAYTKKLVAI